MNFPWRHIAAALGCAFAVDRWMKKEPVSEPAPKEPHTAELNHDLIEFVYEQAQANARFHVESVAILKGEANTTLTLITAAAGAALGYAIKLVEDEGNIRVIVPLFFTAGYLFFVAAFLLTQCLRARNISPAESDVTRLFQKGFTPTRIKYADLPQLQRRCDDNRAAAGAIAKWLNASRVLFLATPLIFWAAWAKG